MPAEWEPHEATWLGWPHNKADWPGRFAPIPWAYGEIVRKIAPGERVRVIADPARLLQPCASSGAAKAARLGPR